MSHPYKICPICNTSNHRNATVCTTCGTSISSVELTALEDETKIESVHYDFRYGETDLYEGSLSRTARIYFIAFSVVIWSVLIGSVFIFVVPNLTTNVATRSDNGSPLVISPVTVQPTINLATVTEGPPTEIPTATPSITPTATLSPTPAPCSHRVAAGDSLISIVAQCGHRDLEVINLVLEINNLTDPSVIQIGQLLEIPWPTSTLDPISIPTETLATDNQDTGDNIETADEGLFGSNEESFDPFAPTATPTLQPGVTWHRVQPGENIIVIAFQYGANIEILSQLNPEIPFSQCDFGLDTGGASCTVLLSIGQAIRVPAPTPTPTTSPTASGSETPTPSPTATFNAPIALSPSNRSFFERDQIITLRWIATGTLGPGQTYRVRIENQTTGTLFTIDTQELSFIIPQDWQGLDDQRHQYSWIVSVTDLDIPEEPLFSTDLLTFTWQGRGQTNG